MTRTIDVAAPNTRLADLVSLALSGTEVILADGEIPLVRLVPVKPTRIADLHKDAMQMTEDFNAPLPDEFWTDPE